MSITNSIYCEPPARRQHRMSKLSTTSVIQLIDLTSLTGMETEKELVNLYQQANQHPVAAICVFESHIGFLKKNTDTPIATVINFPHGQDKIEKTQIDICRCSDAGADELDIVWPRHPIKNHTIQAENWLNTIRNQTNLPIKIILETGDLPAADITQYAELCCQYQIEFIKTSTGMSNIGATIPAAERIIDAINATQSNHTGIKISGGIRTLNDASPYLELLETKMGLPWIKPLNCRFGTSKLLSNLLQSH